MKRSQVTPYGSTAHVLDSFWHVLLGAAFAFILSAWVIDAHAAGMDDAAADKIDLSDSQLWIDSGFWSHHTKQNNGKPYREHNEGLGLEWRYAPQWQINVGHYRNSLSEPSNYLQWGWMPFSWTPTENWEIQAGGSVGVVNGYPGINDKGYFPTLVPALTTQWKRVGVNLVYVPSIGRIHGAFAAQLKLRAF